MDLDHKEEAEDLVEKIRDKNDPTPKDVSVQKWQRQQKLLDRKQAREKLTLNRKLQKKEEDTKWKQEDELSRTQLEQAEEDEDLNDKHEVERKALEEKQQEAREKLEQKCYEQVQCVSCVVCVVCRRVAITDGMECRWRS
jgi:transposase